MAKKSTKPRTRRIVKISSVCAFCTRKKNPSLREYKELMPFISERARIIGTDYTSVCSTHQRKLTREIKRARQLGLLPITPSLE